MASVAKHIKRLRLEKGLTQEALAERLHVTRQAVSNWERNAAQPDLDTLQAIAAALGAEVTEVIYGAPPPAAVTKAVRRRWLLTGALAVLGAAALAYLVWLLAFSNGAVGTQRDGFRYQLGDGAYRTSVYTLTDSWTVALNLDDPAANAGAVLYRDDEGCSITVASLERTEGRWVVTFQAEGALSRLGGRLVSGCYEERSNGSLSSFPPTGCPSPPRRRAGAGPGSSRTFSPWRGTATPSPVTCFPPRRSQSPRPARPRSL